MARQVYSDVLFQGNVLSPSGIEAVTVRAGYTVVVRDIVILCFAGIAAGKLYWENATPTFEMAEFAPPQGGGTIHWHWQGRQVWPDLGVDYVGFRFVTPAGGTNTFSVRCSGYQLASAPLD